MPYSYMAHRYGAEFQGVLSIPNVCFYAVSRMGDFNGYVYGRGKMYRYSDKEAMIKKILEFDISVGFQNYRYDNIILMKGGDKFVSIRKRRFILYIPKDKINIDAYLFFHIIYPFEPTHSLENLCHIIEADYNENREKTIVYAVSKFYWKIARMYKFINDILGIDIYTLNVLPPHKIKELWRWFLQDYMFKTGIRPEITKKWSEEKPDYYRFNKQGFYENIFNFDVSGAYPSTLIRHPDIFLYERGDLAGFMKYMKDMRKNAPIEYGLSELDNFCKWTANALLGYLGSKDSVIINRKVMVDVWNRFANAFIEWVEEVKDVVYAHTDGVYTENAYAPPMEGYDMRFKNKYRWFAVINQVRIIGKIEDDFNGGIYKTQFQNRYGIKIIDTISDMIDEYLMKCNIEEAAAFFKNPKMFWEKIKLDEMDKSNFEKVINKKEGDACNKLEFLDIFPYLQTGINKIYYGSKKKPITNFLKVDYGVYRQIIDDYLEMYRIGGK